MRRSFYIKYLTCFVVLLGYCLPINAQYNEKDFTLYSVRDGLSDNSIYCLQQDDQGYLWIGTDAGLNRFDGKTFKKFYQGTAPLQLPSGSIWRMKRFGPNQLGILSKGGFQVLNTRQYTVTNYYVPDSTAMGPKLNCVWDAVQLSDGSFAMTTSAGFYVFDKDRKITTRHDAFVVEDIGKKRMLYGRDIFKINDRHYLAYINEAALAIYDHEKKIYREEDMPLSTWKYFLFDGISDRAQWVVKHPLKNNRYLFIGYHQDRVILYDHASKKRIISPLPPHLVDSLSWESRFVELNDSTLAINSRTNGFYIFKLEPRTGKIVCDPVKYLPNHKIFTLFLDKDKRLWAGTARGLLKQELQEPLISAYHYEPSGGKKYIGGFSCAYRYKDKLYVGRFALSNGLVIIDPVTMKILTEISLFNNSPAWNEVRSIEMYHKDTLWLGTNGGIIWYATETGRYGKLDDDPRYAWAKYFSAVLAPPRNDGYAWMASMLGGKLVRYHIASRTHTLFTEQTQPALPFTKLKHIVYDAYGDVWIGGHSLARWSNRKQAFDTMITVYGGINKFNDDIVTMRADSNGSIFLHNADNGLLEYRIREKKFVAYTIKDGLASDVVFAMSPVIENKLWIAGNNHLTLFDTRTKQFTIYNTEDGLPEEKPSGRRISFDQQAGLLYLFCDEYLVRFSYSPERKKDLSSGLLIEEWKAGGTKTWYLPEKKLVLRHDENNLVIDYSVIDFGKSSYQFAWRLNDDDPWNLVGNQRSIILNNLPPGHYQLQLKASGKPGIEKTGSLSFFIRPPFWKTTWFIGLAALSLAGCAWLLYRNRIRNIRQKANIDRLLSQTEMKALQAQMNPHFIFNSLNSIREMILNNENKEASHYLSKFARLIRITLDQSTQSLVSLRSTVDYLQRYMEMERIRNSLFTYEISVDPVLDIDEIDVPPMLIQPFIENALWHGVAASNKQIHIKIGFKKENDTLVCTIDDNGIGIRQSQKANEENDRHYRSHGIANIRNRFELLNEKYDLHSRFTIEDKKEIGGETGTLVTLFLPIEIIEP